MKKAIALMGCLLLLLVCGCQAKENNDMGNTESKTVVFTNGAQEADLWILPQTEENLKTTVWGTASAAGVKAGETREIALGAAGDGGQYIFRMIDTDGIFYSADNLTLEGGFTLELTGSDLHAVTLTVTNEAGEPVATYDVFAASL